MRDIIKSEPHSQGWQVPAGGPLFLQLTDQQKVHLCNIPGQTSETPKALWIMEVMVNVRGVFQHLHRIHWTVGLAHRDRRTVRDAQKRVTGRIFFICFHVNSRHWARAQWPIPFPRGILISEAFVNIICLDATFYWFLVNECPVRLSVIWEIYFCSFLQQ